MRRQKSVGVIVVSTLVAFMLLNGGISSYLENQRVKNGFAKVFVAIQQQQRPQIEQMFYPTTLTSGYLNQMFKYKLLGWRFVSISGQPWPMDMPGSTIDVVVECYYQKPDHPPAGGVKFRHTDITHPRYGACMMVPYQLHYQVDPTRSGKIDSPNMLTGENWMAPFEGPAQ